MKLKSPLNTLKISTLLPADHRGSRRSTLLAIRFGFMLLIGFQFLHAQDSVTPPRIPPLEVKELYYEPYIKGFEQMQIDSPCAPGVILFTGSSSIRKWETLREDMAPLPVINRGFGGSMQRQVNHYAPRYIFPLKPSVVVLYCGENDITFDSTGGDAVLRDVQTFMELMDYYLPETEVLYLSMKPSPDRWEWWRRFEEGNHFIEEWAKTHPRLTYLDVSTAMMLDKNRVRKDIFIADRLHMNEKGYAIWTELVKPEVERLYQKALERK